MFLFGFHNIETLYKHLNEKHDLPPPADLFRGKSRPVASEFNGALKVLSIHGCNENDLLQLLTDVKLQFDGLLSENVSRTATEIEFIAKVELFKPTKGEETSLFFHSGIQPVYNTKLPQADFLAMVEKLLNLLFTSTASGSRWVLEKIVQLGIDFGTLNPLRGSSY